MHNLNPVTLKLMYYQCTSNYIKSETNVNTKINAPNENNQIRLQNNIYTEINASNASNQIGLEINIVGNHDFH